MPDATHWVHDLSPFAIRFTETFGVRWYGLAYVCGFAVGLWLLRQYHARGRFAAEAEARFNLIFALALGVLAGGRLGSFLLYRPGDILADPLAILRIWEPGMAAHGAFVGVGVALWWYARAHRMPFLHVADITVTLAAPGILFGRIANFINGELWGKPADVPWAVIFPQAFPPVPRHPSQLYEALAEGLVLGLYLQLRFWRSRAVRAHPGQLAGEFLVAYAILRSVCEVFREPDASLLLGLSRGTFYSAFAFAAGVAVILLARRRGVTAPPAAGPG